MLADSDACVLIGDPGMAASDPGLQIMDLGREWHNLTGLPFVWALWVGFEDLDGVLAGHFQGALETSLQQLERVIMEASRETGFSVERCRDYFTEVMDYGLSEDHIRGLGEFGRRLAALDLIETFAMPELVPANGLTSAAV
jgi:chorismate dehydratase